MVSYIRQQRRARQVAHEPALMITNEEGQVVPNPDLTGETKEDGVKE